MTSYAEQHAYNPLYVTHVFSSCYQLDMDGTKRLDYLLKFGISMDQFNYNSPDSKQVEILIYGSASLDLTSTSTAVQTAKLVNTQLHEEVGLVFHKEEIHANAVRRVEC